MTTTLEPSPGARSQGASSDGAPGPLAGIRLALVGARGIPARYGGFETFAEELSTRLVARGAEVTVFCEASGGARPDAHAGVQLEYVSSRAPGALRTIGHDVAALRRARGRFDVVYLLGYGAAFAAPLARRDGSEVWINMDGLEWRRSKWGRVARGWLRAMEGLAGRRADRLVFDNAALGEEVVTRRGWTDVAHEVVPYGAPLLDDVDPEPLGRLGLVPGEYLLTICRCEPENHLLELVRAHRRALVRHPLVIVSNTNLPTPHARELRTWSSELVRLPGPIYDPELLAPLRAHCRAYLHGHSVGGTNPSLVEAMGAGAAIVAHDNPFNREVLGDAGLWFRDAVSLESVLAELVACRPHELAAFGAGARRRAAEAYSWERVADRYAELLLAARARAHA